MTPRSDDLPVVCVVDDDPDLQAFLSLALRAEGYAPRVLSSGREALAADLGDVSAVCLDLHLGDVDGITVLRELLERDPELPVILVTGERAVDAAVSAMRAGAYDYLTKPVDVARLSLGVRRAVERRSLTRRVAALARAIDGRDGDGLVGRTPAMRALAREITRVLDSDVTVCLLGESGTGKELVARAIHTRGRRRAGPFVAINCAAISRELQESELFGHERGAFTGAHAQRRGAFEQADGGTLLLDELGEMAPATQAGLLRALETRTVRRVGGHGEIAVDARVLSATHRDLDAEVSAGRLREDLYYRLVVFPIRLPPLRERVDDIPLLVAHFLKALRGDVGRDVTRVDADAMELMMRHPWPGNVRELRNVVHRAMLSCEGERIRRGDIPASLRRPRGAVAAEAEVLPLAELERRAIRAALRRTGARVGDAAKLLGIGRATLYRRLAALGLDDERGAR